MDDDKPRNYSKGRKGSARLTRPPSANRAAYSKMQLEPTGTKVVGWGNMDRHGYMPINMLSPDEQKQLHKYAQKQPSLVNHFNKQSYKNVDAIMGRDQKVTDPKDAQGYRYVNGKKVRTKLPQIVGIHRGVKDKEDESGGEDKHGGMDGMQADGKGTKSRSRTVDPAQQRRNEELNKKKKKQQRKKKEMDEWHGDEDQFDRLNRHNAKQGKDGGNDYENPNIRENDGHNGGNRIKRKDILPNIRPDRNPDDTDKHKPKQPKKKKPQVDQDEPDEEDIETMVQHLTLAVPHAMMTLRMTGRSKIAETVVVVLKVFGGLVVVGLIVTAALAGIPVADLIGAILEPTKEVLDVAKDVAEDVSKMDKERIAEIDKGKDQAKKILARFLKPDKLAKVSDAQLLAVNASIVKAARDRKRRQRIWLENQEKAELARK